MKNPFCGDIKCTSSSIGIIDPINNSLPMCILIVLHFTICVTQRIPVLANSKVRFTCIYVVLDITTPKASDKIKSPSIISNFIGTVLEGCANMPEEGIILNPWGQSFLLTKDLINLILQVSKEGSAQ